MGHFKEENSIVKVKKKTELKAAIVKEKKIHVTFF